MEVLWKIKQKKERLLWFILAINAFLFAFLLVSIGLLQHPTGDDLIYLKETLGQGVWNSTMTFRAEWNTRWSAIFLNQFLMYWIPSRWLGMTYQGITLILGSLTFLGFSGLLLEERADWVKKLVLSVFLVLVFYLLTFGGADTWFWLCATPTYLWPCLTALIALQVLFSDTGLKSALLAVICCLYVGGSAEVVSFSLLLTLVSLGVFMRRLSRMNRINFTLSIITLLVSMLFSLVGDGVTERYNALAHPEWSEGLLLGLKNYFKVLVLGIAPKLGIVAVAIVTLSTIISRKKPDVLVDWKFSFGLFDLILILTTMAFAFMMNELGPNRGYLHVSISLLILGMGAAWSFKSVHLKHGQLSMVAMVLNVGVTIWLLFLIAVKLPNEKAFANALKQRMSCIEEQIDAGNRTIIISPIPYSPTFLYHKELSQNPDHWANKQLSTYYGQEFEFVLDSSGKFGC